MPGIQRAALVLPCLLAVSLAGAPAALAGPALPRVSPAVVPSLTTPITVTWHAPAGDPAGARYAVTLSAGPPSSAQLVCAHVVKRSGLRARAGHLVTATLRPTGDPVEVRKWCPGTSRVAISRAAGAASPPVVAATFTIHRRALELLPGPRNTPAAIRLLAGSTITVGAAGHADRTVPVNAVLRGLIPSPFRLNQDITIKDAKGSLVPVALAADPLCPGTAPPFSLRVTSSSVSLSKSGRVMMSLVLAGSPSQLIGCGPGGPLTGTTTIPLTGQTGARGLLALNLDGAADGITLHLLVFVDLFGHS